MYILFNATLLIFLSIVPTSHDLTSYPSIDQVIRSHLHADGPLLKDDIPINEHHLRRLTALSLYKQNIKDLTIFRYARLKSLRMFDCKIPDFNDIRFLNEIQELYAWNCSISNISPLANLTELSNLSLACNQVKDISALSQCKKLVWLDLRNNNIENVSALRELNKLVYVDLRDNPLKANLDDNDVLAIKSNNPGVSIMLGRQFSNVSDFNRQLLARAKISEFALCARLQYLEGISSVLLPHVSNEISDSLKLLENGDDKGYLTDIASLIMRYEIEVYEYYRPGPVFGSGEDLLFDTLLDVVGQKIHEEGIPVISIADWICKNRDKLVPSIVLDIQIEKYNELIIELKRKGILGSKGPTQND